MTKPTICFPFTGDTVGGSHLSVLGLLDQLDRARYRVIVVPQYLDGAIARLFAAHEIAPAADLAWRDFTPGERFTPPKAIRAASSTLPLARFLRRNKVDIVHTNDGGTHATWGPAARLAGARLLWHHRGDPSAMGIRFVAPLIADRVVGVSDFALPTSRVWQAMTKAQVVHSPFDAEFRADRASARQALIEEFDLPPDPVILGYFGIFIARKRPLLFIDVVARLRERLPGRPVIGLLFGATDDPRMNAAIDERIAGLGAADWIKPMGWRTPGAAWIAACDQLVVPAIGEPFGRTLIEAMLIGTPVVATRSGGNIEAIRHGETGLLAPPEDADALAEACLQLATNPAFASSISERAQSEARVRFGKSQHCDAITAIYDELAGPR